MKKYNKLALLVFAVVILVSGCTIPTSVAGDNYQGGGASSAAVGVAGSVGIAGIAINAQGVALLAFFAFLLIAAKFFSK